MRYVAILSSEILDISDKVSMLCHYISLIPLLRVQVLRLTEREAGRVSNVFLSIPQIDQYNSAHKHHRCNKSPQPRVCAAVYEQANPNLASKILLRNLWTGRTPRTLMKNLPASVGSLTLDFVYIRLLSLICDETRLQFDDGKLEIYICIYIPRSQANT